MTWEPSLLMIDKLTKAELIRLANEEIEKECERCLKIVGQYTSGFDPNHRDPRCGATARAIEAQIREGGK